MKFHLSAAALGAALILAASVPVGAQDTGGSTGHMGKKDAMMMPAPHRLVVQMKALNGSGESGTATLSDTPGGLRVVIKVNATSQIAKGKQPAHIHKGYCGASLDPKPEYPLTPVVGGMSTTVVPTVTVAALLASKHAINVHDSKDIKTYVSCGSVINLTAGHM